MTPTRDNPRPTLRTCLAAVLMAACAAPMGAEAARHPHTPRLSRSPSLPPPPCPAGVPPSMGWYRDVRAQWQQTPRCYRRAAGFEATTVSRHRLNPGETVTMRLAGPALEANLRHGAIAWGTLPGPVVAGCTGSVAFCTVRVGRRGDRAPTSWNWVEWQAHAPLSWGPQTDANGVVVCDDCQAGPTTHGSGWIAIIPRPPRPRR